MSGQIDTAEHQRENDGWSEHELELLTDRLLNKFMSRMLESIGYDVSTPESRAQIREDHGWVRDWRVGASKAKNAAMGAGIMSFVGGALWLFWMALKAALKAGP